MEIIRSNVSIANDTTGKAKFFADLSDTDVFGWIDVDTSNNRLYISDDTYLQYTAAGEIRLYNTTGWNGNYASIISLTANYINFQVFKVSETCAAFAFRANSSVMTEWATVPVLAVDTHDGGAVMLALNGIDSTTIGSADGASPFLMQNWAWKDSNSTNIANVSTQIAPIVIPRSGYVCDNLHCVLNAPSSNGQLVTLNIGGTPQMYYFSKGLAIPCGDTINYTYL